MIYQIIDGDRIPVTYVLDQTSRTVVLFLVGQTGSNIQIQVALTDLSENMIFSDEPIIIYTYDRCMFVPEIVINSGAARTQNRNLHVQVNVLPDGTIAPEAPPILYAFLSTDKTVLEQFRNQHVINDDPAQYGTRPVPHPNLPGRWLNSNQWYLDFDDIGLVSPSHLGPELITLGGVGNTPAITYNDGAGRYEALCCAFSMGAETWNQGGGTAPTEVGSLWNSQLPVPDVILVGTPDNPNPIYAEPILLPVGFDGSENLSAALIGTAFASRQTVIAPTSLIPAFIPWLANLIGLADAVDAIIPDVFVATAGVYTYNPDAISNAYGVTATPPGGPYTGYDIDVTPLPDLPELWGGDGTGGVRPSTPGTPIAWAEFTRQPQDINDYWMRAHIEDTDLPTILRIDKSREGFISINWMMSVLEYAQHTGNSFEVWGFIVDLLGNASIIVKDDILIDPPYSRYYPREDDYARRRNHRWRGPKESEKILVSSDEFGYTTSKVVGEMSSRAQDNIISVSAGLGGRIDKVLMNINHIRVQRGQT